jgi:hypothetical protein
MRLVRLQLLTAVKMTILFFWVLTPHAVVDRYQHFKHAASILGHFQKFHKNAI